MHVYSVIVVMGCLIVTLIAYPFRNGRRFRQASAFGRGSAFGDRSIFETRSDVFSNGNDLEAFVRSSGGASGKESSRFDSSIGAILDNKYAYFTSGGFSEGDATSVAGANAAKLRKSLSRGASSAGSACASGGKACITGTYASGQNEHNGLKLSSKAGGNGQLTTGTSNSGVGIQGKQFQGNTRAGGRCKGAGSCSYETAASLRTGRR